MGSRVRGAALLVASLVGAVGLAGCSDDEPAGPGSSASGSPSDPTEGTASGSATTDAAATGPQVDAGVLTYRLPEGRWDLGRGGLDAFWEGDSRTWAISGTAEKAFAGMTLGDVARVTLEVVEADHDPPLRRTGSRVVAGVRGYVIEGHGPAGYYYEWGTVTDGRVVQLEFEFPEDSEQAEEWTEQVLASVEWQ